MANNYSLVLITIIHRPESSLPRGLMIVRLATWLVTCFDCLHTGRQVCILTGRIDRSRRGRAGGIRRTGFGICSKRYAELCWLAAGWRLRLAALFALLIVRTSKFRYELCSRCAESLVSPRQQKEKSRGEADRLLARLQGRSLRLKCASPLRVSAKTNSGQTSKFPRSR